ncbi:MAG TPA: DUF1841 family protein [Gammaproteobacteria bacterium]|nr:DUF1841 family protein [Gammaproteobacteria bacterium]
MLFSNDRNELRRFFFNAWQKQKQSLQLEPMEQIIVNVIKFHPEYHAFLENPDGNLEKDFLPETGEVNPFLHLSMHISIHEQLSVNRPAGITDAFNQLMKKTNDPHNAEHILMDCLGEMIWKAQKENCAPDEALYLTCIQEQIQK